MCRNYENDITFFVESDPEKKNGFTLSGMKNLKNDITFCVGFLPEEKRTYLICQGRTSIGLRYHNPSVRETLKPQRNILPNKTIH